MLLSIITLNYKKPDLTLACMASLHEQFKKEIEMGEIELVIVDNASEDDSVEKIKEEIKKNNYKNTKLLVNKNNDGFGAGNNLGAKNAKGELVLFLNNDTQVKDGGILKMANYLKENSVAILGGQLRNADGTLQSSSGKFYSLFNSILLLLGMQRFGVLDKSPNQISEVDWVKGGLFMIKKSVFDDLSGFDEKIFMYTEDMELCYRVKLAGYKIMFYPDVNIVHAEHGSANRSFAIVHIYKGLLYFYKKHKSKLEYSIIKFLLLTKAIVAIMVGRLSGNSYLVKTYSEAIKF